MSPKMGKKSRATAPVPDIRNTTSPAERIGVAAIQQKTFSGPVPPPDFLHGYDAIIPGAAERILRMAEEDAAHRREMEKAALTSATEEKRRGQHYGLTVSAMAFLTCVASIYLGSPATAIVIGGTTVVGLVVAFVAGRKTEP